MREIADMTRRIVEHAKEHESDTVPGDFATLETPCPKCGGVIKENYKKFQCQKCDFALWKILAGRQLEPAEIEELISKGSVGSAAGLPQPHGQAVRRQSSSSTPEFKTEFDFGQNGKARPMARRSTSRVRSRSAPVRSAAAASSSHGIAYICENATGADPRTCDFRSGKIILQRPIEAEQMQKAAG